MRPAARRKSRLQAGPSKTVARSGFFHGLPTAVRLGAAAVVLCVISLAAYSNSIHNEFTWDDHSQIAVNPALRSGAPWLHLFLADVRGLTRSDAKDKINYYRPLQMLTYRWTAGFFGLGPHPFHALSIAFHMAAVLLVFALAFGLTRRMGAAFAASALFALHPVHSEAVDWISALPDIGCTVFVLLAFLFFRLAERRSGGRLSSLPRSQIKGNLSQRHEMKQRLVARSFLAASCASFAGALLWKETAIVFPLLVAAYVLCLGKDLTLVGRFRNAVKLSLPYCGILAVYFVLRFRVLGFFVTSQRNWVLNPFEFILTGLSLLTEYCWKLLLPIHLNAYYVFSPVRTILDPRALTAIVFLALALSCILYGIRRAPLAAFAAIWMFVALLPVLNVYAVGRNVFAERYLYLPSVGFCLLVVLLAKKAASWLPVRLRLPISALALVAVLLFCGVQTHKRNPDWKDDSVLFTKTVETSPRAPFVQNMVAVSLGSKGEEGPAETHYQRAISLAHNEVPPDRVQLAIAYQGLASIYADHSDFDRALQMLGQVRLADPENPEVEGERALVLLQAQRWPEAEAALQKAVAIAPDDANVLNALGLFTWQHKNDFDRAASYFSRALAVHTEADDFNASLHGNLGGVYGEQGRFSDAIRQFKLALEIAPSDPQYHTGLASAYESEGRINEAAAELQAALAIAPDFAPARAALERLSHTQQ